MFSVTARYTEVQKVNFEALAYYICFHTLARSSNFCPALVTRSEIPRFQPGSERGEVFNCD